MKKVVAILLCMVMMLVGTPVALAADNAVIKVSDVKVNPGDTVSVTISLENNPGITGARIFVDYNSDVLTLKNVENGNVFAGTAPVLSPSFDVVPYQLQWSIGVKDMTDDGVLATMIFGVNENAEDGKYDVSLTYDQEDIFNTKFENVHFDVLNGTVEISSGPATIDDFTYEIKDGGIVITGYVGTSGSVKIGSEYEIDGTVYKVIGIAESAFEGNEIVRSVEIPETVQYVGDYAFYDCTSLVKVTVLGKNTVLGEKSLGYYMINRRLDGVTEGFTIYGYTGSTAEAYAGTEEEITFVALSEECSHNYIEKVVAPTCVTEGYTIHVCDLCGESYIDKYVDKLGHSFTNYVPDKNATCEEDGTKTAKCDRCDATDTITDEGSKLGHSFTNYVPDKNATCEEDGTKTAKCDRCDATDTITDEDSKLGHSFTNYVSDKNATCEEDGTKTAKCDRCDATDTITDEGSKLGHSFTNYVSDKNATCEEDGTKTAKCDRCDATDTITDEDSKLGHRYGEWKHDAGTKTHIRVCENDSTHIESEECTFTSEITKEVGCIENGIRTFTCAVCGYSYDETITSPGHKDNDDNGVCDVCGMNICKHEGADHIYAVKATCASTGNIEYYHCEKCGLYAKDESFKTIIEKSNIITAVDSENHSGKTEIRNAKAANCETDGFTGDTYCLACNAKIADGKKIDKLGHSFTNYVSDKNATCEEDGTKTAKCDRCDATDTITDEGSKLGHSFTNYVPDKNATCEEDGTKTAKCDRYDATDTITDEGSKLGHSFTNYVSDKNATCEEDGTKTAKCDRCDATDTITDEGTKMGHTVVIDAAVAATCKSTGLTEGKHCSACGAVIVPQKVTERLSHNFVKTGEVEATCTKDGYTLCECTECGEQEKTDIVKALGHTDDDDDGKCDVCGAEVTGFKSVEEFMNWVTMLLILVFKFLSMIAAS